MKCSNFLVVDNVTFNDINLVKLAVKVMNN